MQSTNVVEVTEKSIAKTYPAKPSSGGKATGKVQLNSEHKTKYPRTFPGTPSTLIR